MSQKQSDKDLFEELGLKPPEHLKHLTEDELREAIKIQTTHNWKQIGDRLTCECLLGRHSSKLPTTHILKGTNSSGNPILEKVQV